MKYDFFADMLSIPRQQVYGGEAFPLVLRCSYPEAPLDELTARIRDCRDELDDRLKRHGAILFRDFPVCTAQDFDIFVSAFNYPVFTFDESLSNAVRANVTPKVFTANEAPSSFQIMLHHEMAQTPHYPSRLFFFCEISPSSGGATPICRSDELFRRIQEEEPKFARDCDTKGLRYSHVMPDDDNPQSGMGRSWRSTLSVGTKEAAEVRLEKLNYTWNWEAGGGLRANTPVLPAVREISPGKKTYFNQLIAFYAGRDPLKSSNDFTVTHGDGSPLDDHAASHAVDIAESLTFDVAWQTRDVALVDNYLVMHGRRPFEGSRRVLASLVAA